ncbi:MAG: dehydrogenase [Gammaproteobacteria bacterium]|nr:dehydrogenase [Gammaproteobacteria bacterium]MBV9621102.1 dehydrogenase [Gammaproteobacteria bacterium]
MPYLLLIVEPTGQRAARSAEQGAAVYQRMLDYAQELQQKGVLLGVNSLKREAVRLESRAGRAAVLDGPFTEAKELIGGYFLLNVASREEALRHARDCPAAEWATIEVRETGPCYS